MSAPRATPTTADRILDVAEQLAQTRGFNGFSYADIAAEVGITKASLHYHFPTKAALGRALIRRYSERFSAALSAIAAAPDDALTKLRRYVEIYRSVLLGDRMCLCGMLAAEYATLPAPMQAEVRRFFDHNEDWLAALLTEGRDREHLRFQGDPRDAARLLTGALEGSMVLARSYGDDARFAAAANHLLAQLAAPSAPEDRKHGRPAKRATPFRRRAR